MLHDLVRGRFFNIKKTFQHNILRAEDREPGDEASFVLSMVLGALVIKLYNSECRPDGDGRKHKTVTNASRCIELSEDRAGAQQIQ